MNKVNVSVGPKHWCDEKLMVISMIGPRPRGPKQWATCLWNADIFYGRVPFLKTITLVAWLLAVLV